MGVVSSRGAAFSGVLAAALLSGYTPGCLGASWRIEPRVSVEETWSDNIDLEGSANARHDFVTQVTPGVGVVGDGRRLDLFLDYQATLSHYARDSEGADVGHRLQSSASAEVVQDLVFLDATGVVGQRNLDSRGRQSTDLVNVNDNRRQFSSFGASPYLRMRFGRAADAEIRYRVDRVNNEDSVNTTIQAFSALVSSNRSTAKLPWSLSGRMAEEDDSTGVTSKFREIDASARYAFSRHYSLRMNLGYEKNDFQTTRTNADGVTWRATGLWTPGPRTLLEVGYGSRFFGNFPTLALRHRMRRTVVTASFTETVTTSALDQAQTRLFALQDAFGNDIQDPGARRVDIATNGASVSDDVLISRELDVGLTLRGRRTDADVQLFRTRRSSESGRTADEDVYGLSASAARRLSRRTQVSVRGRWQRSEFEDTGDETLWSVDVSGRYRVGKGVAASIGYRHERNDATTPGDTYTENRVNARLDVSF